MNLACFKKFFQILKWPFHPSIFLCAALKRKSLATPEARHTYHHKTKHACHFPVEAASKQTGVGAFLWGGLGCFAPSASRLRDQDEKKI